MGNQTASFFPPLSINSDMNWKKGETQHSPHSESLESSETYKQKRRMCKPILDSISHALTRPLLLFIIFSSRSVCGWEQDSGSLQVLILWYFSITIHLGGSQPPSPFAEVSLKQWCWQLIEFQSQHSFLPAATLHSSELQSAPSQEERGVPFSCDWKVVFTGKIPFLFDTQA